MTRIGAAAILFALAAPASACESQWCPPPTAAAPPPEPAQAAPAPRRERYRPRRHVTRQVQSVVTPRAVSDALRRYRYLTAAASIALAGERLRSGTVTAAELITMAMMPLPVHIDLRDPADLNEIDMLAADIAEPGALNEIDRAAPPIPPRDRSQIIAGGIAAGFLAILALIVRLQIRRDGEQ